MTDTDQTTDAVTAEGATLESSIAQHVAAEQQVPEVQPANPNDGGAESSSNVTLSVDASGIKDLINEFSQAMRTYNDEIDAKVDDLRDQLSGVVEEINKLKLGPVFDAPISSETSEASVDPAVGADIEARVARIEAQIRHMV